MLRPAVRHLSFYPYVQPLARNRARFILEAAAGELAACEMVWWKRSCPERRHRAAMRIRLENSHITQWQAEVACPEEMHYIKYGFLLTGREGRKTWYNAYGMFPQPETKGSFEILQVNHTDVISVPHWSRGCIYYQVFPERFDRLGTATEGLSAWDAAPTRNNYLGGNLKGIAARLPYLADLGIECIYMTPVFLGDFNHKYATTDYFKVDPLFGTEDDLVSLAESAHKLGIRVMLDGVFNHSGIHFPPFWILRKKVGKALIRIGSIQSGTPLKSTPPAMNVSATTLTCPA